MAECLQEEIELNAPFVGMVVNVTLTESADIAVEQVIGVLIDDSADQRVLRGTVWGHYLLCTHPPAGA